MFHVEAEHTVTIASGEDVVVAAGDHDPASADEALVAALEQLWAAGLAVDPDRPQNPDADPAPEPEPSPEPGPRARRGKQTDGDAVPTDAQEG